MNRLAHSDFPAELLLEVVEASVASQVSHWKVTEFHQLDVLAAGLFAWPVGVTAATRKLLVRTAAAVLLKDGIIRIPADLDERRPPAYDIPPALLGKENHVRRLVLDLDIPVGDAFNRDLTVSIGNMSILSEAFPRLAVCTYLLHIEYDSMVAHLGLATSSTEAIILGQPYYRLQRRLEQHGDRRALVKCTLEESLVDIIAAFARAGPGKRKLIRFSRKRLPLHWSFSR